MIKIKNWTLSSLMLLLILALVKNSESQTVSTCWNPAMGTQINCLPGVNAYCQTNLTSGIGSCESSVCTHVTSICCNSGNNCNQIVTQCYNPIGNNFVVCDQNGLNSYCQLSFRGPMIKADQIKHASGTCQSMCTPSNTNDINIVLCCFAQNNCNNLFGYGPHRFGGHSGERGVNGTRFNKRSKLQIRGTERSGVDLD